MLGGKSIYLKSRLLDFIFRCATTPYGCSQAAMTKEEFKEILKEKHRFKKAFESVMAIFPIGAGLFVIYKLTFTDWWQRIETLDKMSPTSIYLSSFLFILAGIWALRTINVNYEVISVPVGKVPSNKAALADWLSDKFNWITLDNKSQTLKFLTRGFWTSGYEIIVACDIGYLHFDIQHYSLGIIDFGVRKRIMRKLSSELNGAFKLTNHKDGERES